MVSRYVDSHISAQLRASVLLLLELLFITEGVSSSLEVDDFVDYKPCPNKNCATIHLFISLTNVDRYSQFFHRRILHEICNNIRVIYRF